MVIAARDLEDGTRAGAEIAHFREFVQPVEHTTTGGARQLSAFCTQLTGITQEEVNAASPLGAVLDRFDAWLGEQGFKASLDKGTADSILCGEGSTANAAKMCQEVSRVLKPSGTFMIISYGVPDNRLSYLENEDYGWTVTVHTVAKPTVSATAVPDTKDANSVHYIYVCVKGGSGGGDD